MKMPSKGVAALLGVVMVATICTAALPSKGSAPTESASVAPLHSLPPPTMASMVVDSSPPIDNPIALQRDRAARLTWARNPFRVPGDIATNVPQQPQDSEESPPQLSGISIINDVKMAIIDCQIVVAGERLKSGYLVVHVTDETVDLVRDEHQITLTLK